MLVIGFGRMGRKFAKVFSERFDVYVASSRNVSDAVAEIGCQQADSYSQAVAAAEYLFIAVPIHALDEVIEQVNSYVRSGAIAFDMCSARVIAGQKMDKLSCSWFGLHAEGVFGDADPTIIEFLAEKGYRYRPMSADEHDRRNSINAVAHFIGMTLDEFLSEKDKETFGPAGANLVKLIDHLRSNAPVTYWESQICNPYTSDQRNRLVSALEEYSERLSRGDFPFSPSLSEVSWE